jgi:hypothetical protein
VEEIRRAADAGGKVEPTFSATLRDDRGEVVAEVDKLLHVRRKDRPREEGPGDPAGAAGSPPR